MVKADILYLIQYLRVNKVLGDTSEIQSSVFHTDFLQITCRSNFPKVTIFTCRKCFPKATMAQPFHLERQGLRTKSLNHQEERRTYIISSLKSCGTTQILYIFQNVIQYRSGSPGQQRQRSELRGYKCQHYKLGSVGLKHHNGMCLLHDQAHCLISQCFSVLIQKCE